MAVISKDEIADVLESIAQMLELKGENVFKVRAYTNAARALETYSGDLAAAAAENALAGIPGVGKAIGDKIAELITTGQLAYFETLKAEFPPGIFEMFQIQGLGPKKIKALWDKLGITTLAELEPACRDGRIAALPGFGKKTAGNILAGLESRAKHAGRFRLGDIAPDAERMLRDLRELDDVVQVSVAGSYRRRKEIVGDLDFIVATGAPERVTDFFAKHEMVESVMVRGATKTSVRLNSGIQADLRVVRNAEYPFALNYFTGSKEHNIVMRQRALARGWTLNEYRLAPLPAGTQASSLSGPTGFQPVEPAGELSVAGQPPAAQQAGSPLAGQARSLSSAAALGSASTDARERVPPAADAASKRLRKRKAPVEAQPIPEVFEERDLYGALGLDYVEPELREDRGEIAAAENHTLPELVTLDNLRGTFHNHTTASDGRNSLLEMAAAAQELGLEYLGIADHSKSSFQAHGLDAERLLAQVAEIRELNKTFQGFRLFAGVECDILKDGKLDFPDELLAQLDYAVGSVHSAFNLPEAEMTARIIRAIASPHITMLGHLTGRLLLARDGYAVDVPAVIEAAAATGTIIELNASRRRLDMDWRWWPLAKEKGVKCAINPDAHHTSELQRLWLGVGAARKGWLTRHDVINCLPFAKIQAALGAKRARAK